MKQKEKNKKQEINKKRKCYQKLTITIIIFVTVT